MSKEITVQEQIKNTLVGMESQFKAALPKHIDVAKFTRIAQTAILTNPAILGLDRSSVFKSCLEACQAGLLIDSKESAIVPFKGSAKFMPMIAGILKLLRNSGELSTITAQIIYKNDDFKFWIDDSGEHIKHTPVFLGEEGEMVGTYALAKLKDGSVYIEVMDNLQVKDIQNCSKGSNTPWNGPFKDQMIKKSVLKRLCKRLPISTDIDHAINADNDFYDLPDKKEKTANPELKTVKNLAEVL